MSLPCTRKKQNVYDAFRPFLPPEFERAFQEALEHATPWAATRFQPRSYFGTSRVWLLGDAVGHVHPISGMGMTFGILDAVAAASAASLGQYRSAREVYVSELLTNLLYTVFQRHDASATRVRHALLKMLRKSPTERRRTMQILTSETDDARSFALSFMKASRYAVQDRVLGQPLSHESRAHRHHESSQNWASSAPDPSSHGRFGVPGALRLAEALKEDASWFKWPLSALVSEVSGLRAHRAQSTIERPFPEFSDMLSSGTRLLRERAPLGRSLHALTLGRKISARP